MGRVIAMIAVFAIVAAHTERINAGQRITSYTIDQPAAPASFNAIHDPGPAPAPNEQIAQPRQQQTAAGTTTQIVRVKQSRHATRSAVRESQRVQSASFAATRFAVAYSIEGPNRQRAAASSSGVCQRGCAINGCNCGK